MRSTTMTVAMFASVLAGSGALAQARSAPATRAEVKAEARAAAKSGSAPAELKVDAPEPARAGSGAAGPTTRRADRKAETRNTLRIGDRPAAGDATEVSRESAAKREPSLKSRADRKAETKAARNEGALTPAGERPGPSTK
jgi:hypothetical protein